jgi:hypothetical protein
MSRDAAETPAAPGEARAGGLGGSGYQGCQDKRDSMTDPPRARCSAKFKHPSYKTCRKSGYH